MTRFRVALLCVLTFGLLATSCTKPVITKAEYIEKIDALCKNSDLEIEGMVSAQKQDPEKTAAVMDRSLAIANKTLSDMENVARPTNDDSAAALEEFFTASRMAQEATGKFVESVKRSRKLSIDPNDPKFQKAQQESMRLDVELGTVIEKMKSAAKKYGFKECGK